MLDTKVGGDGIKRSVWHNLTRAPHTHTLWPQAITRDTGWDTGPTGISINQSSARVNSNSIATCSRQQACSETLIRLTSSIHDHHVPSLGSCTVWQRIFNNGNTGTEVMRKQASYGYWYEFWYKSFFASNDRLSDAKITNWIKETIRNDRLYPVRLLEIQTSRSYCIVHEQTCQRIESKGGFYEESGNILNEGHLRGKAGSQTLVAMVRAPSIHILSLSGGCVRSVDCFECGTPGNTVSCC